MSVTPSQRSGSFRAPPNNTRQPRLDDSSSLELLDPAHTAARLPRRVHWRSRRPSLRDIDDAHVTDSVPELPPVAGALSGSGAWPGCGCSPPPVASSWLGAAAGGVRRPCETGLRRDPEPPQIHTLGVWGW